jgi:DNA-binding HxlR family transcriptional regulator
MSGAIVGGCTRELAEAGGSYALTAAGEALIPALEQISLWAEEHFPVTPA